MISGLFEKHEQIEPVANNLVTRLQKAPLSRKTSFQTCLKNICRSRSNAGLPLLGPRRFNPPSLFDRHHHGGAFLPKQHEKID
jgi:hypothetical protein